MGSHFIIEYERIVVKCQRNGADHYILIQGLVPETVCAVALGRTFAGVLTTESHSHLEPIKTNGRNQQHVQAVCECLYPCNGIHAGQSGVRICGESVGEEGKDGEQGGKWSRPAEPYKQAPTDWIQSPDPFFELHISCGTG